MTTTDEPVAGVSPSTDRLRVSGPAQLLQAIPYLLGFEPEKSVVMLALSPPRRRVRVTMRVDLAAPRDVIQPWLVAAQREGCDELLAVIYDDEIQSQPLPHRELVDQWELDALDYSLVISDALAVANDRWWSYRCHDLACCPPAGNVLRLDQSVAAKAVSYGMVAAPRRDDLVEELAADKLRVAAVSTEIDRLDAGQRELLRGESGYGSVRRARAGSLRHIESTLQAFSANGRPTSASDAALALLGLCDFTVRDAAVATVPGGGESPAMSFWRDLTRCAPAPLAAAPATLYALCAYAAGDGTRTNVGIDRALADYPGYRLAELLDSAASGGLRPSLMMPDLVAGAIKERRKLLRRGRRAKAPETDDGA